MTPKICVLGDVILDHTFHGRLNGYAPEFSNAPAFVTHQAEFSLGGVGNVVRQLAALGQHIGLYGFVGENETNLVLPMLSSMQLVEQYCDYVVKGFYTSVKTRYMSDAGLVLRVDELEPSDRGDVKLDPDQYNGKLLPHVVLRGHLKANTPPTFVLSDYGKGAFAITYSGYWFDFLNELRERQLQVLVPVIVDTKRPGSYGLSAAYGPGTILKMNLDAAAEYAGHGNVRYWQDAFARNTTHVDTFCRQLTTPFFDDRAYHPSHIVVTIGGLGALLISRHEKSEGRYRREIIPATGSAVPYGYTCGCGDVFTAVLAAHAANDTRNPVLFHTVRRWVSSAVAVAALSARGPGITIVPYADCLDVLNY